MVFECIKTLSNNFVSVVHIFLTWPCQHVVKSSFIFFHFSSKKQSYQNVFELRKFLCIGNVSLAYLIFELVMASHCSLDDVEQSLMTDPWCNVTLLR